MDHKGRALLILDLAARLVIEHQDDEAGRLSDEPGRAVSVDLTERMMLLAGEPGGGKSGG